MPTLSRTTRSGANFACWDGPHVIATHPSFDFQGLLKQSTERAQSADCDACDLFSLSPLTSPEPSRPPSPAPPLPNEPLPPSLEVSNLSYPVSSSLLTPPYLNDPSPPPTPSATSITTTHHRVDRLKKKKAQSHASRNNRRAKAKESRFSPYESRPAVRAKYIDHAASIQVSTPLESSHVARTAFVAVDDRLRTKKTYRLHEVVGPTSKLGFALHKWDGVLSPSTRLSRFSPDKICSTPMPILDRERRLFAILAGHPDDDSWPDLSRQAAEMLEEARGRCQIPAKAGRHRRGHFAALRSGVSHGGGQKAPGNLQNSSQNDEVVAELNQKLPFRRNSGFATSVLATWAPDLHAYYAHTLDALHTHDRSLKRIFPTSVFASTTYNFGPRTVCFKHTDFANLAFGMCAVTAFGDFDPKKGGHLILWECGLVIEFPPGSTILLPSATISHSNVTIGRDERRYSFTQYTAGGLFRWVENGFQKSTDFRASLSPEESAKQNEKDEQRWAWGLSLLPRFILPESV